MSGDAVSGGMRGERPPANSDGERKNGDGASIFDSEFDGNGGFDGNESRGEFDDLLSGYAPVSRGEVTATLVDELQSGNVPEPVLVTLGELGIGVPGEDRSSVPVAFEFRLERVQAELSKLSAYTDAIEAFIDEHGSGRRLLTEVQASIARLDAGLADVTATVDRLAADQREFDARLSDVERVDDEVAGLHASVGAVEATVEAMTGGDEEAIQELAADVAENRRAIQETRDVQKRFLRAFSGAVDDLQ